ncbi:MAG: hypothetical protein JWN76_1561 [Chitinophagaceae bacterium]|nr:hypothetical protein [Chitinophagaceae bacterium]
MSIFVGPAAIFFFRNVGVVAVQHSALSKFIELSTSYSSFTPDFKSFILLYFAEMKVSADQNFQRYYSLMRTAGKLYAANPGNKKLMHMNLSDEDVLNLLQALNKHKVKYLLVGGMAVVFHGYVRTTQDMDIWLKKTALNQKRLAAALKDINVDGYEFLKDTQLVMGYTSVPFGKNGFSLDMGHDLKLFKQADFEVCYKRSVKANFDGVPFNVIHIKDLLAEKMANNRTKDKLDIEELGNITAMKKSIPENSPHQSKKSKK